MLLPLVVVLASINNLFVSYEVGLIIILSRAAELRQLLPSLLYYILFTVAWRGLQRKRLRSYSCWLVAFAFPAGDGFQLVMGNPALCRVAR